MRVFHSFGLDHLREVVLVFLHGVCGHVRRTHHGAELNGHFRRIDALLRGGADVGEGLQTLVTDDRNHLELPGLHLLGDIGGAAEHDVGVIAQQGGDPRPGVLEGEELPFRAEAVLQHQPGQRVVGGAGPAGLNERVRGLLRGGHEVGERVERRLGVRHHDLGLGGHQVIGVSWARLTFAFATVIGVANQVGVT